MQHIMLYERMAYIVPGRVPGYRRTARGSIEVWWPDPPDEEKPVLIYLDTGFGKYERKVDSRGVLNLQEAAVALFGADRTTVYRLIKGGHLRAVNHQGKIFVPRQSIESYLIAVSRQRRGRRLGEGWGET